MAKFSLFITVSTRKNRFFLPSLNSFFGAGGKKTNILRYMKRTVLFCPLFRVLVWLSIVENKKVRSNLFELNFDSSSTYWNYDFSLKCDFFSGFSTRHRVSKKPQHQENLIFLVKTIFLKFFFMKWLKFHVFQH